MEELDQAQKDFLTGFFTRDHLISALIKRMSKAKLENDKFSILLIDIDHFKKINDKYGHLWGDEYLRYVASTLRLTLENKGLIFRYGGDEFVVLFSDLDPRQSYALARQFNVVMRNRPFLLNGRLFRITLSCGLATYPDNARGAEELLKIADKALYFSKRYGRNATTVAGKIGLQRFKMILVVLLEFTLIIGGAILVHKNFLDGSFLRGFRRFSIRRLLPTGTKSQTKIILKTGDVIFGEIVNDDQDKLIVDVSLEYGQATMNIEKDLIQSILRDKPQ